MDDRLLQRRLGVVLDDTRARVAEYGWAVQAVFPADDAPEGEYGFTYTVGLTGRGRPELWVGTLAPAQAGLLLNEVAKVSLEEPDRVQPGAEVDVGWSVSFRVCGPCDLEAAETNIAAALYPWPQVVEVWQVLWPDPAGRFPDEDGYDHAAFPQRVLPARGTGH